MSPVQSLWSSASGLGRRWRHGVPQKSSRWISGRSRGHQLGTRRGLDDGTSSQGCGDRMGRCWIDTSWIFIGEKYAKKWGLCTLIFMIFMIYLYSAHLSLSNLDIRPERGKKGVRCWRDWSMFDGYPVVIVRGLELEVAIIQMTWGAKELTRLPTTW